MAQSNGKAKSFNRLKKFGKSGYSGMKIGAGHKWHYDRGEWREHKLSPDEWNIYYQTTKRRAGKAPEGSGAPVGTEYNWLIVSHQRVDKLDANSYMTCMEGRKFKVAHRRASKGTWNVSEASQRKKVIQYLEQVIEELKEADEDEEVIYAVGEQDRIYGLEHRNKAELNKLAAKLDIGGRSKMSKQELVEAVREAHREHSQQVEEAWDEAAALQEKTRDDLYRLADERKIDGRSRMKKSDLVRALKEDMVQNLDWPIEAVQKQAERDHRQPRSG